MRVDFKFYGEVEPAGPNKNDQLLSIVVLIFFLFFFWREKKKLAVQVKKKQRTQLGDSGQWTQLEDKEAITVGYLSMCCVCLL